MSGEVVVKRSTAQTRNVMACLSGTGPHAGEWVVVGAHYDHLGKGQMGHMFGPVGSVYHGADDNASGVAAVLELAARLRAAGPLPRSVLFVLFSGEEEGLIGSDFFVKHPPVPLDRVAAMLNLDMVGRLKGDALLIGGEGTARAFDGIVAAAVAGTGLHTSTFERGGLGPSDHMSFALQHVPVLFLFTGLHADYHRPTDTADKINYPGLDRVVAVADRIVTALAAMPRQTYDGSADGSSTMALASGHGTGGGRASLGVVPDYSAGDGGRARRADQRRRPRHPRRPGRPGRGRPPGRLRRQGFGQPARPVRRPGRGQARRRRRRPRGPQRPAAHAPRDPHRTQNPMNTTAIVIVDHGSRRAESNRMLEEIARRFGERFAAKYDVVEPAHMELDEPSLATAYRACVTRGAQRIVVVPFFLGPGKHWTSDIPRLVAEAAMDHPGTTYHVAPVLGIDDLILDLLEKRATHCQGHDYRCDLCRDTLRSGQPDVVAAQAAELKADKATPHLCGTCPFKGQALPGVGVGVRLAD